MFSFGDSFENSLKDAQNRGYAERNPDADVLGIDACRKITILTALVTGKLLPTELIHTEGITAIRKEDVMAAAYMDMSIKLLGRCIITDDGMQVIVAPFLLENSSPLSTVSGVYNAIEVIGDPIGNVVFYGQGAGAGATAPDSDDRVCEQSLPPGESVKRGSVIVLRAITTDYED